MGAISEKIAYASETKALIAQAIVDKGGTVADTDAFRDYATRIGDLPSGGFTGHVDAEGLTAIGWDADDIAYYQANGVTWNEEDDVHHLVPQYNIDLYGTVTLENVTDYIDYIVYLPKIDTSGVTSLEEAFMGLRHMVTMPWIDTSSVTSFYSCWSGCYALELIPELDFSAATTIIEIFYNCYSLRFLPVMNTVSMTKAGLSYAGTTIGGCYSLQEIRGIDFSAVPNSSQELFFWGMSAMDYSSLKKVYINHAKWLVYLSSHRVSADSLRYIINNAETTTSGNMYLGATNLSLLTEEEIAVATDKGWILT